MRLIDADALSVKFDGHIVAVWKNDLDAAPTIDAAPQWVSVKERLPEAETKVLVIANRHGRSIITTGIFEDGTIDTENSCWNWYDFLGDYDEENDCYIIPQGWWEDKEYNGDDEYNHQIDDFVTHWMPLPEPPKEEEET